MYEIKAREVPNRHYNLLKSSRLKEIFPGARFGKGTKDEIEYAVYRVIQQAILRAERNGRVTVYPYDI